MTIRSFRIPRILAAPACALLTAAAAADSPDDAEPDQPLREDRWEELVVVASHLPRPAREVGSAVTVLTSEDLERRRLNLAAEVLREVPGLAVNRVGQEGALTQVRIRGAEGNHTLVLIDGIEANDPALTAEFNFANLLTWDLGRIEVIRGPQSALYGSEAIGGVVSLSTVTPERGLDVRAEVEGGSFGTRQYGASAAGGGDRVRGLLSATRYDTDGISASAIDDERDGYDNTTLHGKVDVDVTDRLSARLVLRRSDSRVEEDRQDFDFPPTPTQGLVIDADNATESSQLYGLAEVQGQMLGDRWLHRAGFGYTRTESDSFADGTRAGAADGERHKFSYDTTLRLGNEGFEHALTAGVQHERLAFDNLSATLPGANQSREDEQTSLVAEYAVTWQERFAASFSARRDDNDRFDDATTVRAAASYLLPAAGTRLHGSYGEGITNPNFFELFGFLPDSFVGNPDLQPEYSRSWDVGVEQALLGGRALVDLTWFSADLRDEIVTIFLPSLDSTVVNQTGISERDGLELTAEARLGSRWHLRGSYTHLDATDPDGARELRRPRHSGSINLNYAFLDGRGNVNLGALFNGSQRDSEFVSATPATVVTLDDYTLVNLAVSLELSERVEIFARGENLLDEDYTEVFGYASPGAAGYLGLRARL